ncbi:MAG: agmatine deiminase family protein [Methanobacteriota archaeon]|nr:MAG: agmatine deiminase family protein [Euryarchaeota archaeon]
MRDNGPIFVTSNEGDSAIAHFGFNGWGESSRLSTRMQRFPRSLRPR